MLYVIHPQGRPAQAYSAEDLARNAQEQRNAGYMPRYRQIISAERREYSRPGYLVYSTIRDGAAIVILDEAGNAAQILTGPQGDFAFMIDEEEKTA